VAGPAQLATAAEIGPKLGRDVGHSQGAEVAGFSAADAAFTGFRVVWERPWAALIWAGVQFVVSLALNLFIAISAGAAFSQLTQLGVQPTADPEKMMTVLRGVAPTYVAVLIAVLVLAAVFYAAMNRAVMRPAESRFGYLRLASDELRQLGHFVLLLLLAFGFYLVVLIVASVVVGVLAAALGATGQVAVGVLLAVLLPVLLCVFIYLGVRLSLASPLTFATGRINIFGSWGMTRGRFWPLFGAYLIAFALGFVVTALTLGIGVLAVAILGGGVAALGPAFQSDLSTVAANLSPARLIYLAISSIGAALSAPITICPPAAIYLALTGGAPASISRTFE
jgi:hypothetical protein